MMDRIYTVGHSTRDFDEMLAMLRNNEITHLVDVRSFPSSRKFPQWNQSAIIGALPPDPLFGPTSAPGCTFRSVTTPSNGALTVR